MKAFLSSGCPWGKAPVFQSLSGFCFLIETVQWNLRFLQLLEVSLSHKADLFIPHWLHLTPGCQRCILMCNSFLILTVVSLKDFSLPHFTCLQKAPAKQRRRACSRAGHKSSLLSISKCYKPGIRTHPFSNTRKGREIFMWFYFDSDFSLKRLLQAALFWLTSQRRRKWLTEPQSEQEKWNRLHECEMCEIICRYFFFLIWTQISFRSL